MAQRLIKPVEVSVAGAEDRAKLCLRKDQNKCQCIGIKLLEICLYTCDPLGAVTVFVVVHKQCCNIDGCFFTFTNTDNWSHTNGHMSKGMIRESEASFDRCISLQTFTYCSHFAIFHLTRKLTTISIQFA